MGPQLIGIGGSSAGMVLDLGAELTFGREAGNSVVINDSSVSRRHARIAQDSGGFTVTDLGSSNGTRVNGAPVNGSVRINPGDQIEFGSVGFRFDAGVQPTADYLGQPPTYSQPRRPEVSSREVGYSLPMHQSSMNSGCAMPNLDGMFGDLSALISSLMRFLPLCLIVLLILIVGFLVITVGGVILASMAVAPAMAPPVASPAPSAPSGPPAGGGSSGGGSPPPADQQQAQQEQTTPIQIISARIEPVNGACELLVHWKNAGQTPIEEMETDVTDAKGNTLATDFYAYRGVAVQPGQEHEDRLATAPQIDLQGAPPKTGIDVKLKNLRVR